MARPAPLIWTEAALADADAAAAYIACDSRTYAASFVRKVRATARSLKRLPVAGALVLEVGDPSIREIFVANYRLIYRVESDRVAILRLIHGAREMGRVWR
jgi:plasmid stabilization system protein ParE